MSWRWSSRLSAVPARDLARAVLAVFGLVDPQAAVYTQGFRPTDWPKLEATISNREA